VRRLLNLGCIELEQRAGNGQQYRSCTLTANSSAAVIFCCRVRIVFPNYPSLTLRPVHQSGELETLLESNDVIPKVEGEAVPVHAA
jgi:hypothetical protein